MVEDFGALCWREVRSRGSLVRIARPMPPDLTSPEASIADAAAKACFEQLCTEGSAHGFELPAALKVRAAAELRDPKEVEAAKSLVALVVQTAHASTADDALLAGIAALASAVLNVDAALAALGVQAAKLRRRLLTVLEGCLLSASMLVVREQGRRGRRRPAASGRPGRARARGGSALAISRGRSACDLAAGGLRAGRGRCSPSSAAGIVHSHTHSTPMHAHCVRRCAPPPPTVGRPPRAPRAARPAPVRGGGGPGRRAR